MKNVITLLCFALFVTLSIGLRTNGASAKPSYFDYECSGCHTNDNPTCNGCHHHGPQSLSATTDKAEYVPGEQVVVTFDGGTKSGWIRAILYDEAGVEIDRATGPTHMGDDGQPNPVEFPVTLTGAAPAEAGQFTWEAAWWGSPYDTGNPNPHPHGPEVRTQVDVVVGSGAPVEATTWGRIKALWR
jgi:hypothetical protein